MSHSSELDEILADHRFTSKLRLKTKLQELIARERQAAEEAAQNRMVERFKEKCHINVDGDAKYFKEDFSDEVQSKFYPQDLIDHMLAAPTRNDLPIPPEFEHGLEKPMELL